LIWRPYRARRRETVFPGLKPRAEPSRPLRGEEASQILLNLAPFGTDNEFDRPSRTGPLCIDTQALRAWLLSSVPPGQKPFAHRRASQLS
jgi:hypothetical protein